MKHFLQILVAGAVLFVLLGLFNQQGSSSAADGTVVDYEQVLSTDGILSPHQAYSAKHSKFTEKNLPGKWSIDIRKVHETSCSHMLRAEYLHSYWIYKNIMCELLLKKGMFPHLQSDLEILS